MPVTFSVFDVDPAIDHWGPPSGRATVALQEHGFGPEQALVASSHAHRSLLSVREQNVFIGTARMCFDEHRPLVLSPDHFWLAVLLGLGLHIRYDPEAVRRHFTSSPDRITLSVRCDRLNLQSPLAVWMELMEDFSQQLREELGAELHTLLTTGFSTTGPVERTAFQIALMAAVVPYYSYQVDTLCGIPQVTLEGTPDDWEQLRDRVLALGPVGLGWWTSRLEPLLEELVRASQGRADRAFWRHLYRLESDSGCPDRIDGWLQTFVPYLMAPANQLTKNRFRGAESAQLPPSFAAVPVLWNDQGRPRNLKLAAGFLGCTAGPETAALRPAVGWVVSLLPPGSRN